MHEPSSSIWHAPTAVPAVFASDRPLRVLFLCTGNSARSQLAEAILTRKGAGRFVASSAGSHPAPRINPETLPTLRRHHHDWPGHPPQSIEAVQDQHWDVIITVCDNAKESCPILPGQPVMAHWGMPDPADVEGPIEARQRAFDETYRVLSRRIDLLLALPLDRLEALAVERQVRAIGQDEAP